MISLDLFAFALTAMAPVAMAGSPSTISAPAPTSYAPVAATAATAAAVATAAAAEDCNATCSDLEVAAFYGLAGKSLMKGGSKKVNIEGVDLTYSYCLGDGHSVNLRGGYAFGDRVIERDNVLKIESDTHTFFLMPGYRYTFCMTESLKGYIGANLGVANLSVKEMDDWAGLGRDKFHDSKWGFAYSLEAGVRYAITQSMDVFAGYQFFGHQANPTLDGWDVKKQQYHMIRAGLGFSF